MISAIAHLLIFVAALPFPIVELARLADELQNGIGDSAEPKEIPNLHKGKGKTDQLPQIGIDAPYLIPRGGNHDQQNSFPFNKDLLDVLLRSAMSASHGESSNPRPQ
ncbi:hypothetical protein RvY_17575-1 [Ramazzottius varieornatus]|uniref:Uncharacterized protein n=1 Tax=Ramazzottius varieornatus TaxID=947166 RepID=A0A1D1W2K5_RAMVA|nr:hypothetical protein RvY_17575-1 [Ramazzottius varieornatus]